MMDKMKGGGRWAARLTLSSPASGLATSFSAAPASRRVYD
jgi:hypothetical protein